MPVPATSPSLASGSFLAPFLNGAIAMATSELLAYQQLARQTDTQQQCAKQQIRSQQVLQIGGVLTVVEALLKVAKNEKANQKLSAEDREMEAMKIK
jgi:hypothetical protein